MIWTSSPLQAGFQSQRWHFFSVDHPSRTMNRSTASHREYWWCHWLESQLWVMIGKWHIPTSFTRRNWLVVSIIGSFEPYFGYFLIPNDFRIRVEPPSRKGVSSFFPQLRLEASGPCPARWSARDVSIPVAVEAAAQRFGTGLNWAYRVMWRSFSSELRRTPLVFPVRTVTWPKWPHF